MNALEAALAVAGLALPFHALIQWQLSALSNPRYVRERGVVVRREEVLQYSSPIGFYLGRQVFGEVRFLGMLYRFDRVTTPAYRNRVQARELFLEPGLVYRTD